MRPAIRCRTCPAFVPPSAIRCVRCAKCREQSRAESAWLDDVRRGLQPLTPMAAMLRAIVVRSVERAVVEQALEARQAAA